jgi:AhpD family alkylhydroperoxidase
MIKQFMGGMVMSRGPREILNDFLNGLQEVGQTNQEQVNGFFALMGAGYKTDVLDLKTKELMSVALGAYIKCEYCIVYHVYKSLEAGCTPEEIMEAAMVAVTFGGGPSMAYTVTLLKKSIEEFAPDFR